MKDPRVYRVTVRDTVSGMQASSALKIYDNAGSAVEESRMLSELDREFRRKQRIRRGMTLRTNARHAAGMYLSPHSVHVSRAQWDG